MVDKRKFQVFENKEWKEVEFSDVRKGDIFRAFEEDGESVLDDNGVAIFEALTDYQIGAFTNHPYIQVKPFEGEIDGE